MTSSTKVIIVIFQCSCRSNNVYLMINFRISFNHFHTIIIHSIIIFPSNISEFDEAADALCYHTTLDKVLRNFWQFLIRKYLICFENIWIIDEKILTGDMTHKRRDFISLSSNRKFIFHNVTKGHAYTYILDEILVLCPKCLICIRLYQ